MALTNSSCKEEILDALKTRIVKKVALRAKEKGTVQFALMICDFIDRDYADEDIDPLEDLDAVSDGVLHYFAELLEKDLNEFYEADDISAAREFISISKSA
jgi:AcrR family transcriptional regulator